jgi:hypothetical protein
MDELLIISIISPLAASGKSLYWMFAFFAKLKFTITISFYLEPFSLSLLPLSLSSAFASVRWISANCKALSVANSSEMN